MRLAFSRPAFRQAWEVIGNDSNFGPEFHRLIDGFAGVETRPKESPTRPQPALHR